MAAVATLAPFQQPMGLAPREALAHAHNHIERLTKKHEAVLKTAKAIGEKAEHVMKKNVAVMTNAAFAASTAGALGYVNGRYGGEKGYVAKYGVAIEVATAALAHASALALSFRETGDKERDEHLQHVVGVLHTVGDAAIGVGVYRWTHQKGVEAARHAGVPAASMGTPVAQPNGARGAVYAVTPAK